MDNPKKAQQGRCLGFLWSRLLEASSFTDKEAHCQAGDIRNPHSLQTFTARHHARSQAYMAIGELPVDEQDFWSTAERPQRPGEPDEPDLCP